jgi:hypothetical protein
MYKNVHDSTVYVGHKLEMTQKSIGGMVKYGIFYKMTNELQIQTLNPTKKMLRKRSTHK